MRLTEGMMICPKCEGNQKIVVFKEFKNDVGIIENIGLLKVCDNCHGIGKVDYPDW